MKPQGVIHLIKLVAIMVSPCPMDTLLAIVSEVKQKTNKQKIHIFLKSQLEHEKKTPGLDNFWEPRTTRTTLTRDISRPGSSLLRLSIKI